MSNNKLIVVNDDGIKVRYDNLYLLSNYFTIHVNELKQKGVDTSKEKFYGAGKQEWIELCKKIGLPVVEFNDDFMIISWDAVDEWKTIRESIPYVHYINVTKIKGLEKSLKIEVTDNELSNYFNKIIPEKRTNKIDLTPFLKAKNILVVVCLILLIWYTIKFLLIALN